MEGKLICSPSKLTTAIWSLDHTSRKPSQEFCSQDLLLNASSVNVPQKRTSIYLKYLEEKKQQLKYNVNLALEKINLKKNEILTMLELRTQSFAIEIKKIEQKKSLWIDRKIKEISSMKNSYSNDETSKFDDAVLDEKWVSIPDTFDFSYVLKDFNQFVVTNSKFLSPSVIDHTTISPLKSAKDYDILSYDSRVPLFIKDTYDEWTFFHLLTRRPRFRAEDLLTELEKIGYYLNNLSISIRLNADSPMKPLSQSEEIPEFAHKGWPRLYLISS